MTENILKHLLPDYGAPQPKVNPLFPRERVPEQPRPVTARERTLVEAAYAKGFDAGAASARKAAAVEMEAEIRAAAERLAEARTSWIEAEAADLAAKLRAGLAALDTRVSDAVARALGPLLEDEAKAACVRALADALAAIWSDDSCPKVEICGPSDLLDALRQRLGDDARRVVLTPGGLPEARATLGDTILETNLSRWVAAIRGVSR